MQIGFVWRNPPRSPKQPPRPNWVCLSFLAPAVSNPQSPIAPVPAQLALFFPRDLRSWPQKGRNWLCLARPPGPNWVPFAFPVRFDHSHFELVSSFELRASDFPLSSGPPGRNRARLGSFHTVALPAGGDRPRKLALFVPTGHPPPATRHDGDVEKREKIGNPAPARAQRLSATSTRISDSLESPSPASYRNTSLLVA